MAGIMANSASATMVSGDTAVDNTATDYLAKETIGLTVTGSGSTFLWSLSKPSGSGMLCALDATDEPACGFTPDVEGYYVVTCLVDGSTLYVLRIAVAQVVDVATISSLRLVPVSNASIPTPATGAIIFYSSDLDGLAKKLSDGTVSAI